MKNSLDSRLPDLPEDTTSQQLGQAIARWLFEISCLPELSNFRTTFQLPHLTRKLYGKVLKAHQRYLQYKLNQLRKHGREPTCKRGCAFCCQFMPSGISALEVIFLYDEMHQQKHFSRTFRRFLERQEVIEEISADYRKREQSPVQKGRSVSEEILLEYRQKRIPCPLLTTDGVCLLYSVRPFVCREYFSCSPPSWCDPSHPHYSQALRIAIPLPEDCQSMLDKIDQLLGLNLPETLSEAFLVFTINVARFKPIVWNC